MSAREVSGGVTDCVHRVIRAEERVGRSGAGSAALGVFGFAWRGLHFNICSADFVSTFIDLFLFERMGKRISQFAWRCQVPSKVTTTLPSGQSLHNSSAAVFVLPTAIFSEAVRRALVTSKMGFSNRGM